MESPSFLFRVTNYRVTTVTMCQTRYSSHSLSFHIKRCGIFNKSRTKNRCLIISYNLNGSLGSM